MNSATPFLKGRLVNSATDEELKCLAGNGEIETACEEPGKFFGNREAGDLALNLRAEV